MAVLKNELFYVFIFFGRTKRSRKKKGHNFVMSYNFGMNLILASFLHGFVARKKFPWLSQNKDVSTYSTA